jgi:hypothetical protein
MHALSSSMAQLVHHALVSGREDPGRGHGESATTAAYEARRYRYVLI